MGSTPSNELSETSSFGQSTESISFTDDTKTFTYLEIESTSDVTETSTDVEFESTTESVAQALAVDRIVNLN